MGAETQACVFEVGRARVQVTPDEFPTSSREHACRKICIFTTNNCLAQLFVSHCPCQDETKRPGKAGGGGPTEQAATAEHAHTARARARASCHRTQQATPARPDEEPTGSCNISMCFDVC